MKLIDKDVLVAEIERRKQDAINNCGGFKSMREHECDSCIVEQYKEMQEILDSLEVREVDLDKDCLTWKDMLIIHRHIKDAMNKYLYAFQTVEGQQKIYEDVLKRFKAQKGV